MYVLRAFQSESVSHVYDEINPGNDLKIVRSELILRDIEGMPYEDIAQIIEKPVGTVKSRINRARLMLKDKMAIYVSQ